MAKGCSGSQNWFALIGRILIASLFIVAGIIKIVDYQPMQQMAAHMGLNAASWLVIVAIVLELGGGVMVFFGLFARFGAFLLLVYVLASMFWFHSFWVFQGGAGLDHVHHYFESIVVLGGLLYVMAFGAGGYAVDCCRKGGSCNTE